MARWLLLSMSYIEISFEDIDKRITTNAAKCRVPIQGEIEITSLCNFKCIHCYVNSRSGCPDGKNSINIELFKAICDQLRSSGCIWLLITGGEPLIHPNFTEMWKYAWESGLRLSLFTNGSLICDEHVNLFSSFPPDRIEVSVYSLKPTIHKQITHSRVKPSEIIQNLKKLSFRRGSVFIKTPLLQHNYSEIDAIQKIAKEYKIGFRMDAIIHPSISGCRDPIKYRVSHGEAANIVMKDNDMRNQLMHSFKNDRLPFDSSTFYLPCSAGVYSFHIGCNAKVNFCSIFRNEVSDLRFQPFEYGWKNLQHFRNQPKKLLNNECDNCKLKIICPHCPAIPHLHNERPDYIDKYICNYTKQISQISGIL
jgi:radical SAM protein with 4Fe4S-binding SPASM domain